MSPARPPLALLVPGDVDTPTGGNRYDRRLREELGAAGVEVSWHPVPGAWPEPSPEHAAGLLTLLARLADGATVLLDGLVACGVPEVVLAHADRLRLAVLVHLPLAMETGLDPSTAGRLAAAERRVLEAVDAVVVTSPWTAAQISGAALRRPPVVAEPGTDPAPDPLCDTASDCLSGSVSDCLSCSASGTAPRPLTAAGTAHAGATGSGGRLLCLGSVTPRKGQRLLLAALAGLTDPQDPPWQLHLVGGHRDTAEVEALLDERAAAGLAGRVKVCGPLVGEALEERWRSTDLLVVPSHLETFGMVVTEALARGLPVLATTGSALPATLGRTVTGVPGLLVPPGDVVALREALCRWLGDAGLRRALAGRARERAGQLAGWDRTAALVLDALVPDALVPDALVPDALGPDALGPDALPVGSR